MELGADVNAADSNGYTALHGAAALGDYEMVEFLVAQGADVNAVTDSGYSAAALAEHNGRVQMAKFLRRSAARADV